MPHLHRHFHDVARGIIGTMKENLDESRGDKHNVDENNKRDDPVGGNSNIASIIFIFCFHRALPLSSLLLHPQPPEPGSHTAMPA